MDENNSIDNRPDQESRQKPQESSLYSIIMSLFHSIIALVAMFVSFKCNDGFDLASFFVACSCPYVYLLYAGATNNFCMSSN